MIWLQLFWSFFKIGLTCFGGGYAMIGFIQQQVVTRYAWISPGEFTDIVAVSQMTPGPVGINMATYVGYTASGHSVWGAVVATLAVCLPSFFLVLAVGSRLMKHRKDPAVEMIFRWLRLVVIGLIAAAALVFIGKPEFASGTLTFTSDTFQGGWKAFVICAACFYGGYFRKIHPVKLLLLAGLLGYILF